ncbi:hypothetical protein [Teichococcus vastitatis]|uniref:Uncharacterized protein n=1 Tax=Teichococcus vastitatis TaxID=2307076 RepID=A0ABS9W4E0_9PROT|nr:hypothetical protein [Pseudoroseomonas vastitatis]MCI0754158.1 hypothetical protein [Pseudoroseomonas vastitatis]
MVSSLAIPGMPEWTGLLLLLLGLLCAAAFLLMPFSVFGVKARLEALEVQLDEIQGEIRELAFALQDPVAARRASVSSDGWVEPPSFQNTASQDRAPRIVPPVLPPASYPDRPPRPSRAEPRLDWPRQR